MTSPDQIPDQCPKCGGDVGLRPQIEKTLGSRAKEWRCAQGCMSWGTVR
jgi:hypothetical protein